MRLAFTVLVLAGCHREVGDVAEPVAVPVDVIQPVPTPSVVPAPRKPPPAPTPAKIGTPAHIYKREAQTLCVRDAIGRERCRRLEMSFRGQPITAREAPHLDKVELTIAGQACTYDNGMLACGSAAPVAAIERHGSFYVYLESRDRVQWFEPAHDIAPELGTMAPFPGGIAQLEIGFRVGCARTTNAEVYCWSDPRKPRKVATPPRVAEIVLQDPFELCVRTEADELHCTPPFTQPDALFCSKDTLACGTGEIEKRELKTSFDPLSRVMRPLRRVTLGHPVLEVQRDEDPIYQFCLDSLAVGPTSAGACTLGGGGKVSCFSACNGRWRIGTVAGLPSTTTKIWSEGATGYALDRDGALWWWQRALDCDASANVSAKKMANLPPIAALADPLSLRSGPQTWQQVRCALGVAGEVRCWETDHMTGTPAASLDPMR